MRKLNNLDKEEHILIGKDESPGNVEAWWNMV
jgi:hypothetical protein